MRTDPRLALEPNWLKAQILTRRRIWTIPAPPSW
jgi:hypothetical protein